MDLSLRILQEMVKKGKSGVLQLMASQRVRYDVMTEQKTHKVWNLTPTLTMKKLDNIKINGFP